MISSIRMRFPVKLEDPGPNGGHHYTQYRRIGRATENHRGITSPDITNHWVSHIDTLQDSAYDSVMPARNSLNVSLTPELEKFIEGRVSSGRYQTASEVVREGLRLLELQERDRDEAHKALKSKLRKAADEADRGELADGEEFIEKLLARLGGRVHKPDAA
jgi:antitoxin ParD1/3/4